MEEEVECTITFKVNQNDTFNIDHIQMGSWSWENDNLLDLALINTLLDTIYD